MAIPQLKQSCCGCTLETGSRIIGWLCLICEVLWLISGISMLFITPKGQNRGNDLTWVAVVAIISAIIGVIFSALLLIGINKKIPRYVLWWVWLSAIGLALSTLSVLVQSIMLMAAGAIGPGIGALLSGALGLVIAGYLTLVVYSYYRELIGENRPV